ncbi:hypothetical protein, partial [Sulfurimonas sp.]|uniref:hypothetical protein n=1 Tax=Sulfurimonas sp. TaxID=2022749 RepID=UPI00260C5E28
TAIRRKFNEIIHTDGVEIFNYLLMNKLSSHEYQNLDASLKSSLVAEKIIFANDTKDDIVHKLHLQQAKLSSLGSENIILGTLFTQYTILDKQNKLYLVNPEQKAFIDLELSGITYLKGKTKSGKSSLLLLKALSEILKNPLQTIVIIKATPLARDILHKQLIEIIEHAIVELDLTSIKIMTAQEFIQSSQHKNLTILCDDANLLEDNILGVLLSQYKNAKKVFVNAVDKNPDHTLTQEYQSKHKSVMFRQTHPYAKVLSILPGLLKKSNANDIIIISDDTTKLQLHEDLESFLKESVYIVSGVHRLAKQNLDGIVLTGYDDLNELDCEHIILLHDESVSVDRITYAIELANSGAHILFEEESPKIKKLKEKYESD